MKIEEVTLFSNNIQGQKHFYGNILNFEQLFDSPEKISFKTGNSILNFEFKQEIYPSHIAFNIPSNSINDALFWLKQRVKVIKSDDVFITDFSSWNAKAIYFYDLDNNIIEFISRERLPSDSMQKFTAKSILSIGEIAIATDDIESTFNTINSYKPIPLFDGNFSRFCALGDDEGLFILINKNLKKWYPTNDEAFTSDFTIKGDYNFSFINGEFKKYRNLELSKTD